MLQSSRGGVTGSTILVVEDDDEAMSGVELCARRYKAPLSLAQALDILNAETDAGAWDRRIVTRLPDVVRELEAGAEGDARMADGMGPGA